MPDVAAGRIFGLARFDRRKPVALEALPATFAAAAAEWAHDKPELGERPVRTRPTLIVRRAGCPTYSGPVQRGTSGGVKGVVRCHKQRMKTARARSNMSRREITVAQAAPAPADLLRRITKSSGRLPAKAERP